MGREPEGGNNTEKPDIENQPSANGRLFACALPYTPALLHRLCVRYTHYMYVVVVICRVTPAIRKRDLVECERKMGVLKRALANIALRIPSTIDVGTLQYIGIPENAAVKCTQANIFLIQ